MSNYEFLLKKIIRLKNAQLQLKRNKKVAKKSNIAVEQFLTQQKNKSDKLSWLKVSFLKKEQVDLPKVSMPPTMLTFFKKIPSRLATSRSRLNDYEYVSMNRVDFRASRLVLSRLGQVEIDLTTMNTCL